ncbi:DUF3802 family protein [Aliidiomarina maris]|uniref:DUF3802 domain-containing protein n=1 Tax=Aliidiomarina maris TaxID=531312 RepID=A0A327X0C9_9GAMM|nr:DUF3802 family protein [Aliidiomarina maris]MBA3988676.1 DUF3802 domain-containing protein [Idiomarina sp.]MCL5049568.1 DUF3802 family protein [Bacillota bacterium]RAJ98290.1 uncharacterized protein DUF3802 [Aliidiomarina maris]RUO24878.1 DUF3802 domain-containing protein [Aliidiomarina maris]
MIVESDGYIELIQYLTQQLGVFEAAGDSGARASFTVREQLEDSLSDKIMRVSQQHDVSQEVRFDIVREADAILYDLEEVLASVLNTYPTESQQTFIEEFTGLVKNLLDARISELEG